MKTSSFWYMYKDSHCGDKTNVRSPYLPSMNLYTHEARFLNWKLSPETAYDRWVKVWRGRRPFNLVQPDLLPPSSSNRSALSSPGNVQPYRISYILNTTVSGRRRWCKFTSASHRIVYIDIRWLTIPIYILRLNAQNDCAGSMVRILVTYR